MGTRSAVLHLHDISLQFSVADGKFDDVMMRFTPIVLDAALDCASVIYIDEVGS